MTNEFHEAADFYDNLVNDLDVAVQYIPRYAGIIEQLLDEPMHDDPAFISFSFPYAQVKRTLALPFIRDLRSLLVEVLVQLNQVSPKSIPQAALLRSLSKAVYLVELIEKGMFYAKNDRVFDSCDWVPVRSELENIENLISQVVQVAGTHAEEFAEI